MMAAPIIPELISADTWHEQLNMMPPLDWREERGAESFTAYEPYDSERHYRFVRIGTRHYRMLASRRISIGELAELCHATPKVVDVLAVMEDAARRIYVNAETQDDNEASEALLQARAAVDELIKAAKDKQRTTGGGAVCTVAESLAAHRRMDAALARVGAA